MNREDSWAFQIARAIADRYTELPPMRRAELRVTLEVLARERLSIGFGLGLTVAALLLAAFHFLR